MENHMKKITKFFVLVTLICLVCSCMLVACKKDKTKAQLTFEYVGAIVSTSTGSTSSNKFNVNTGEQIKLISPTKTLKDIDDGKEKFAGWRYGDKIFAAGESIVVGETNITMTAVWKKAYSLSFVDDAQKASSLPSSDYCYEGETIRLSSCTTNDENFNFGGWEYDGDLYTSTFVMPDKAATLKAFWTDRYTVTFLGSENGNSAVSGSMSVRRAEKNNYVILPECGFTFAGYDFVEWKDVKTGETYSVGDRYEVTGNVAFAAVWEKSKTTEDEYFSYTLLSDGTYSIAKAPEKDLPSASLVLPSTYNDQPITVVADGGFARCGITSVVIPESIVEIKANAFNGCTALTMVKFDGESRLTAIADLAFDSCVNLKSVYSDELKEGYLILPDRVLSIGNFAFRGCAFSYVNLNSGLEDVGYGVFSKTSKLTYFDATVNSYFSGGEFLVKKANNTVYAYALGSKNTEISVNWNIAQYTFAYATNLKKVTLEANVANVGGNAFEGCTGLNEVNTVAAVNLTALGASAFSGCSGLTEFYIGEKVEKLTVNAFSGCSLLAEFKVSENNPSFTAYNGSIYSKDMTSFILIAPAFSGEFTLNRLTTTIGENSFSYSKVTKMTVQPGNTDGVTICDKAFYGCFYLTSFEFWNKVCAIGEDAFGSCIALESVTFGDKLTSIGQRAFLGCAALNTLNIEDTCPLTTVSRYAFSRTGLTTFKANGSVVTLDENSFAGCDKLISVSLNGVKTIKAFAFDDCTAVTSVNIPASVETIEYGAFNNCDKLTRYYVSDDNAYFSTDDDGSLYDADKTVLICAHRLAANKFVIPASVTTIAPYAFYQLTGLKAIDASDTALTTIGEYAFEGSSLTSFDSTDTNLTTIGRKAFYDCKSLTTVILSANTKTICESAFGECTLLTSVTFDGNQKLTTVEKEAFRNCVSLTIYLNGDNVPVNMDDNAFFMNESALSGNLFKFKIKVDKNMLAQFKAAFPQWTDYFTAE